MTRILSCIFSLLLLATDLVAQEEVVQQNDAPYHIFFSPYFQMGLKKM